MSEYLFEYVSIIILSLGISLYIVRHEIKDLFKSPSSRKLQAKLEIKVKNGYLSCLTLLYHNCNKYDFEKKIKEISIERTDGRYIGGYNNEKDEFDAESFILDYFYEVLNYTNNKNKNFIFSVDSNFNMKNLYSEIEVSLGIFTNDIELSYLENINLKDRLLGYREKLNKQNIQMTFLSDGSDSYYFILHPIEKEIAVKEAIHNIGLEHIILN